MASFNIVWASPKYWLLDEIQTNYISQKVYYRPKLFIQTELSSVHLSIQETKGVSSSVSLITFFIVAYLSAHLGAEVYEQILQVQKSFSTTIVLSGSRNTGRTGKSLLTTCWSSALLSMLIYFWLLTHCWSLQRIHHLNNIWKFRSQLFLMSLTKEKTYIVSLLIFN